MAIRPAQEPNSNITKTPGDIDIEALIRSVMHEMGVHYGSDKGEVEHKFVEAVVQGFGTGLDRPLQLDRPMNVHAIAFSYLPVSSVATITLGNLSIPVGGSSTPKPTSFVIDKVLFSGDIIGIDVTAGTQYFLYICGRLLNREKARVIPA